MKESQNTILDEQISEINLEIRNSKYRDKIQNVVHYTLGVEHHIDVIADLDKIEDRRELSDILLNLPCNYEMKLFFHQYHPEMYSTTMRRIGINSEMDK